MLKEETRLQLLQAQQAAGILPARLLQYKPPPAFARGKDAAAELTADYKSIHAECQLRYQAADIAAARQSVEELQKKADAFITAAEATLTATYNSMIGQSQTAVCQLCSSC